jgi:hypothetical protein
LWDNDNGDLRLQATSGGIDAGDNHAMPRDTMDLDGDGQVSERIPYDLVEAPRCMDLRGIVDTGNGTSPIVDMGAYEREDPYVYVFLPLALKD